MSVRHKMIKPYMETARAFARLSRADRKKVGYIAVTPQDIVIYSWNGRPAGDDNCCEVDGVTHPEVLHAERNIIAKAAREGISLKGATLIGTCSPCPECALQIHQAGIESVIYEEEYRLSGGVEYLRRKGIHCEQFEEDE